MPTVLGSLGGIVFLGMFWLVAIVAVQCVFPGRITLPNFLVANRQVGLVLGAVSVSVAWIWAPALFVASQKAYEQGIPGIFWFAVPNAGALIVFAFAAGRMRNIFDHGYTVAEFMNRRFGRRMEGVYTIAICLIQIYAVVVNMTGALLVLTLVTGIQREVLVVFLGLMMVSISLLKGIRSSLTLDSIKGLIIAVVVCLALPGILNAVGWSALFGGMGGVSGTFTNVFDANVAWTFGVPISISLLSGAIVDQQLWQRAFAIRRFDVKRAFLVAGALFALVPLSLSVLGFVGAGVKVSVPSGQNQLVGFYVLTQYLPIWGVLLFVGMVLAGLVAAGASALNALGSMGSVNVYRLMKPYALDRQLIVVSRVSMVFALAVSVAIALIPSIQIVYLVLLVGAFRGALFVPTILALSWARLQGNWTFWGILLGMVVGVPMFVYGSVTANATIASFGSLIPLGITLAACLADGWMNKRPFDWRRLSKP